MKKFLLPTLFLLSLIPSATLAAVFDHNLKVGMIETDVQTLQKLLNHLGFTVAQAGGGSPGNETTKFGRATQIALTRFQKSYKITPTGGYFGSATRAQANALLDAHPDWTATASSSDSHKNVNSDPVISPASSSPATLSDLESQIKELRTEIEKISNQSKTYYAANTNAIALTNKIDQLTNTTITTPTITGGSLSNTSISGGTISGATITGTTGTLSGGTIAGATADQATVANTVGGLASLTTPHSTDLLPIVDMSGTPTGKNIQRSALIARSGSARIVVVGTSGVNQTIASGSQDLVTFAGASVTAGSFVTNTHYVIQTLGTTDFTAIGAGNNPAPGTTFRATGAGSGTGTAYVYVGGTIMGGPVVAAGSFVAGRQYAILTTGTTDFTLIGASGNTVGYMFTASGPGTGTGAAYANTDGAADLFNSRIVIPAWANWVSVVGHIGYNNQTNGSAVTGPAFVHLWRNGLPTSEAYMHTDVPYIPNYGSVTSVLGISGWVPVQSVGEYWTLVAEQRTGQNATLAKLIAPENWLLVAYHE